MIDLLEVLEVEVASVVMLREHAEEEA